jgi:predicted metal-dependent hydrolase
MTLDWTEGGLAEGLRCYRAGEFFAAHENWEDVWLELEEPEKTFLQSLIQVAAAFHHFQRGNKQGTMSLLKAALGRLDLYPASFGGVSVTPLCEEIRKWLRALEARDALAELPFPQIRLDRSRH